MLINIVVVVIIINIQHHHDIIIYCCYLPTSWFNQQQTIDICIVFFAMIFKWKKFTFFQNTIYSNCFKIMRYICSFICPPDQFFHVVTLWYVLLMIEKTFGAMHQIWYTWSHTATLVETGDINTPPLYQKQAKVDKQVASSSNKDTAKGSPEESVDTTDETSIDTTGETSNTKWKQDFWVTAGKIQRLKLKMESLNQEEKSGKECLCQWKQR